MEEVFIGRQAILDQRKNVYGYEILFRSGLKNAFDPNLDGNVATQSVMVGAMLDFGMNKLVSDKHAFINFTEQNLLNRAPRLLPSENVVVEILENVQPTPEILAVVQELKEAGYRSALDDFVLMPGYEPLIEMADIIKVGNRPMTRYSNGTTHCKRSAKSDRIRKAHRIFPMGFLYGAFTKFISDCIPQSSHSYSR